MDIGASVGNILEGGIKLGAWGISKLSSSKAGVVMAESASKFAKTASDKFDDLARFFGNNSDDTLRLALAGGGYVDDGNYFDDLYNGVQKSVVDDVRAVNSVSNQNSIAQEMLNSNSANAWGVLDDDINQGVKHFNSYWIYILKEFHH